VPEGILNLLKLLFLALLYLFLARVLRVVYLEVTGPRRRAAAPAPTVERKAKPGGALRLRVVEPPEAQGQVYPVTDEMTVGRAPGCGVVLTDDTYVSQLHARIYAQNGEMFVEDLGSTNGTYVNRQRLSGSTDRKSVV